MLFPMLNILCSYLFLLLLLLLMMMMLLMLIQHVNKKVLISVVVSDFAVCGE